MSLYNRLMGNSSVGPHFLRELNLVPGGEEFDRLKPLMAKHKVTLVSIPRYRDAYLKDTGEGFHIVVLNRTGGGNREDYADQIKALQDHPAYVKDWDAEQDNTFACWEFQLPDEQQVDAKVWAIDKPNDLIPSLKKYDDLIKRMDKPEHKEDPDVKRAFEVGDEIANKIMKSFDDPDGPAIIEV